jgi:hypothetical protein
VDYTQTAWLITIADVAEEVDPNVAVAEVILVESSSRWATWEHDFSQ